MRTYSTASNPNREIGRLKLVAYGSLIASVASMLFVAVLAVQLNTYYHNGGGTILTQTSTTSYKPISISGNLITPPLSLPDAPPITTPHPANGSRLTNLNVPLNTSELAVINNASQSYFVTAAQMYLNRSLTIPIGAAVSAAPLLLVNGKPSVTYLGAISCVYCGENRWAMALALSRFGEFQQLFKGYSALGDGDVPTIYWAPAHYNSTQAVEYGNFYSSSYINFLSIEYSSPITGQFQMGTLTYFQQEAVTTANPVYANATQIIIGLNNYAGTPYTLWGKFSVPGADASNFGDSTINSNTLSMASLTHEQIFSRFAHP
ncbi:MAG: DUF929 domain-containing protein, partial [Thaumarchaeota archaeon]|nr:DUF929 domain-containing protein [Nitrososphaerota archaeon]